VAAYSTAGFERLELTVAGVRTVAYVAGSGPDFVYFTAAAPSGFDFAATGSPHFRALLPYHPGFGESADAASMDSLEKYVKTPALFDALSLTSFHPVGARWAGGWRRNLPSCRSKCASTLWRQAAATANFRSPTFRGSLITSGLRTLLMIQR
jgi:hypothetical protein